MHSFASSRVFNCTKILRRLINQRAIENGFTTVSISPSLLNATCISFICMRQVFFRYGMVTVIVGLFILTAPLLNQSSIYVYNDVICPLLKCLLTWIEDATLYTKARPLAQVKQRQKQAKWMQIIRSAAKASQGRNLQE